MVIIAIWRDPQTKVWLAEAQRATKLAACLLLVRAGPSVAWMEVDCVIIILVVVVVVVFSMLMELQKGNLVVGEGCERMLQNHWKQQQLWADFLGEKRNFTSWLLLVDLWMLELLKRDEPKREELGLLLRGQENGNGNGYGDESNSKSKISLSLSLFLFLFPSTRFWPMLVHRDGHVIT